MGSVQQTLFQNRTMGVVNVCLSVSVCQCQIASWCKTKFHVGQNPAPDLLYRIRVNIPKLFCWSQPILSLMSDENSSSRRTCGFAGCRFPNDWAPFQLRDSKIPLLRKFLRPPFDSLFACTADNQSTLNIKEHYLHCLSIFLSLCLL